MSHPDPSGPLGPVPVVSPVLPLLVFDRQSIQAVDREAVEDYGVPGILLMENAARGLLEATSSMLDLRAETAPSVLILCGGGNNGGDGYALARHLRNHGSRPMLLPLAESRPGSDAAVNRTICSRMGLPCLAPAEARRLSPVSLLVDAVFGTGLDRAVRGEAAAWIEWMNARNEPVLAVDVPSGLDCNTGKPLGTAVRATRTATFVGLKEGFLHREARDYLGDVRVIDIGAPIELYRRLGRPLDPGDAPRN